MGSNVLYVRYRDTQRKWGIAEPIAFEICANPPTSNITYSGNLNLCSGQSILLNGTTGSGYTYQWFLMGWRYQMRPLQPIPPI